MTVYWALLLAAVMLGALMVQPSVALGDREGERMGPPPHMFDRHRPFSEEEIDAAVEILTQMQPDFAERVKELRETYPERVGMTIQREFPRLRHFMELRREDPAMFELRVQDVRLTFRSRELVGRIKAAREADERIEADDLTDELEDVVREHFGVRQEIRKLELENLERRIEQLRVQLEARADAEDELVEQRVADLLGTPAGAEW